MRPEVFADFRDMLVELERAGAEFLIVGAYALAAHGYPRATKDIDIFIRPSVDNAVRVMAALERFGAPTFGATRRDFAEPGLILQIGLPPRRIDIINSIEGVSFDDALVDHLTLELGGVAARVIGRDALLKNKRAVARPQDLVDVAQLEAVSGSAEPSERRPREQRKKAARKKKKAKKGQQNRRR